MGYLAYEPWFSPVLSFYVSGFSNSSCIHFLQVSQIGILQVYVTQKLQIFHTTYLLGACPGAWSILQGILCFRSTNLCFFCMSSCSIKIPMQFQISRELPSGPRTQTDSTMWYVFYLIKILCITLIIVLAANFGFLFNKIHIPFWVHPEFLIPSNQVWH